MRPVKREEIMPLELYERARDEIRPVIIEAKRPRRVHVGPHLTLLFENTATIRYASGSAITSRSSLRIAKPCATRCRRW